MKKPTTFRNLSQKLSLGRNKRRFLVQRPDGKFLQLRDNGFNVTRHWVVSLADATGYYYKIYALLDIPGVDINGSKPRVFKHNGWTVAPRGHFMKGA